MRTTFTDVYVRKNNVALGSWIEVMRIAYFQRSPYLSSSAAMQEKGFYPPSWDISIFPVPRAERKQIRDRLMPALEDIARHLAAKADLKTVGNYTLRVIYDREKDLVHCLSESKLEPERL